MEKKKGLFVPEGSAEKASKLLQANGISVTSRNGLFVWDLVSFIIGFVLALAFGIAVF